MEEMVREIVTQECEAIKKSVVETMMNAVIFKQQKMQDSNDKRDEEYMIRFGQIDEQLKTHASQHSATAYELQTKATSKLVKKIQDQIEETLATKGALRDLEKVIDDKADLKIQNELKDKMVVFDTMT